MDIYERLGVDTENLGCVMLDLKPLPEHLYDAVPEPLWYTAEEGYGRETDTHITLLYGLLVNANTIREEVEYVLGDTLAGYFATISGFGVFKGGEKYDVIYAAPHNTQALYRANRELSRLPHVNLHGVYIPHITIGYVLPGTGELLLPKLNAWHDMNRSLAVLPTGLNFGRPDVKAVV